MSRASGGSRSGCRLVSGSLRIISSGGRGDSSAATSKEVAQRAVGQLGRLQRPQQAALRHLQFKIAVAHRNLDSRIRKGIANRRVERDRIADFTNRLHGGGEIGAIAAEHRRMGADLRAPRRRIAAGVEMIVETPIAHALAQEQQLGRVARVAAVRHHAVERRQVLHHLPPRAGFITDANARPVTDRKNIGAAQCFAEPLIFELDDRIAGELRF